MEHRELNPVDLQLAAWGDEGLSTNKELAYEKARAVVSSVFTLWQNTGFEASIIFPSSSSKSEDASMETNVILTWDDGINKLQWREVRWRNLHETCSSDSGLQ